MERSIVFDVPWLPEIVVESATTTRPADVRREHQILHIGGLTMDVLSGAASWRGKMFALPGEDRQLLGVFMRRAGQIIIAEQLAHILGISVEALDGQVKTLREVLTGAGSTYLPYTVEGLGYILWRL